MKKCILAICLILGTVIGSGFSTGKEIAVFFSRFGYYSLLFIPIAFVLFYFSFYFLMSKGQKTFTDRKKSKIIMILLIICCTVFSASMFAGIQNCTKNMNIFFNIILFASIFLLCFFACFKKLEFLSKINLILIPLLLIIILAFFLSKLPLSFEELPQNGVMVDLFGGAFFCVLYIILNISMSSVVISGAGRDLTKKQIKCVSFVSSLILSVFILLINLLIICNYDFITSQMPLLELSSGIFSLLLSFVIMVGCLTTLLSTIYIASSSCKSFKFSDLIIFFICVVLPFILSNIGFASIVSWLYPFVSFIGVVLLFLLYFPKIT